jgi:hypothetical protein
LKRAASETTDRLRIPAIVITPIAHRDHDRSEATLLDEG